MTRLKDLWIVQQRSTGLYGLLMTLPSGDYAFARHDCYLEAGKGPDAQKVRPYSAAAILAEFRPLNRAAKRLLKANLELTWNSDKNNDTLPIPFPELKGPATIRQTLAEVAEMEADHE